MKITFFRTSCLLLVWSAFAGANDENHYQIPKIIPGYTVQLIEQEIPLGKKTEDPKVTIENKSPQTMLLEERQRRANEIEAAKNWRKKFSSSFDFSKLKEEGASSPLNKSIAETPKVSRPLRFEEFKACAMDVLPFLKAAYAAQVHGSQAEGKKILLRTHSDRGDQSGDSLNGIACGKFLGPLAIIKPELVDEIKILLALTSRSPEETTGLLQAFAVTFLPESPAEARPIWQYYWNRLSTLAVLTKKPLPKIDDLKMALLTPTAKDNIEDAHIKGLQFSQKTLNRGDQK